MTIEATPSRQIKRLHSSFSGLPLKQFARERAKGPYQSLVREWFANKKRHPKKRTPAPGHGGLNWKRFGKKKASRGSSSSSDRSGKKSKDKQR